MSSHQPSAAPASVGTATAQPTRPIMPRPYSAPGAGWAAACCLRRALAPTWWASAESAPAGAIACAPDVGVLAQFGKAAVAAGAINPVWAERDAMDRGATVAASGAGGVAGAGTSGIAFPAGESGVTGLSMAHPDQPPQHARFQLGQYAAQLAFLLVQLQEFALDGAAQGGQIVATDGAPHRQHHLPAGLDQHALVQRDIGDAAAGALIGQDAGPQRRHAIAPLRQYAAAARRRLDHQPLHVAVFGVDLEWQQHRQQHRVGRRVGVHEAATGAVTSAILPIM